MASIQTAIQLTDQMTAPIRNITNNLNWMINSLELIKSTSERAFDGVTLNAAREEIARTNIELEIMVSDMAKVGNQIERNISLQRNFSNSVSNATPGQSGLLGKVKSTISLENIIQGTEKIMKASDNLAQTTVRINLMNDGMQTTQKLQDKIFQSAERARTSYDATVATVSKLGTVAKNTFGSNDETIKFTELMNKSFRIEGSSPKDQTTTMYRLTQAMASGTLQGDEYKSISGSSPLLTNAIEDYMVNVQHAKGSMEEWASQGMLTADVIKNALFNSADEINKQFGTIPITFADVVNSIKNTAERAFQPFLKKVSDGLNSEYVQQFISNIISPIIILGNMASWLYDIVANIGIFISDNWSMIAPIVGGIVAAIGMYVFYLGIVKAAEVAGTFAKIAMCFASYAHAAATRTEASTTARATAAQYGFNTALLSCPITWIILAIIAFIAIVYLVVGAINKLTGETNSAAGIIVGVVAMVASFIGNAIIGVINFIIGIGVELYNLLGTFANFFANLFTDPIASIMHLFSDLFDFVLGIVQSIAKALDTVFGGTHMADAVAGFRNSFNDKIDGMIGSDKYKAVIDKAYASDYQIKAINYLDAFGAGYDLGEGIEDKIKSFFKKNETKDEKEKDKDSIDDYQSTIPDNLSSINDNTKNISDSLDITNENLKYIRDFAEERAVNRYTTATIKVDMTNHNSINSDHDIDGIVTKLKTRIEDEMYASAEGVH